MGLISALVKGGPVFAGSDTDPERMWTVGSLGAGLGMGSFLSSTGIRITPELALSVSCVFQGVRLISETVGSLPLALFRRLDDGSKEEARDHPLWDVLHDEPNSWQTSQEFREVITARALLWSGSYAEIKSGPRGWAEEIIPFDPDHCVPRQLPSGRIVYHVVRLDGTPDVLTQERVFRLRGFGLHRFLGGHLLALARQAIGLWLAQEKFEATYFRQGARPSLWMKVPGKLSEPAYERLLARVSERHAGVDNMHKVLIGEEGSEFKEFGFSLRDSQMTQAREAQVLDIARWLNIPEHMLRAGKQPTFASVEQFAREFVDYTTRPWTTRWEQAIRRDLIAIDRRRTFAKFNLDALLRGHTLDRYRAYALGIANGIISENEARDKEDLPPAPGLDRPQRSVNQGRGPVGRRMLEAPAASSPSPPRELLAIAEGNAERVVRKEIAAVKREAVKLADAPTAWREWLERFYGEHAAYVSDVMQVPPRTARRYCDEHQHALLSDGIAAVERWERDGASALMALALGR